MKHKIRSVLLGLGVDDVGFALVGDYRSPASPPVESLFPGAHSLIVMAYRELAACESPSPALAMNARLDLMAFSRSACYQAARFVRRDVVSFITLCPTLHVVPFRKAHATLVLFPTTGGLPIPGRWTVGARGRGPRQGQR